MKITYRYVTGEVVEVEVEDQIGERIATIEHDSDLKDRAETRRHQSLDWSGEQGVQFADPNTDIASELELAESNQERQQQIKHLLQAMDQLLPQQRELVQKGFFENRPMTEVAAELGITKQALNNRLNKVYQRLRKFL